MENFRNLKMREYQKFVSDNLVGINNIELLILKGHIMVEYSMNLYLESISKAEGSDFFRENFTFSNKLAVIKHFGIIGSRDDNLYQEIFLLNKLRNDIAHSLKYNEQHLQSFFDNVSKKYGRFRSNDQESTNQKFITAITFVLAAIFAAYKFNTDSKDIDEFLDQEEK